MLTWAASSFAKMKFLSLDVSQLYSEISHRLQQNTAASCWSEHNCQSHLCGWLSHEAEFSFPAKRPTSLSEHCHVINCPQQHQMISLLWHSSLFPQFNLFILQPTQKYKYETGNLKYLLIRQCMSWEYRELSGIVKLPSQIATWLSPNGKVK